MDKQELTEEDFNEVIGSWDDYEAETIKEVPKKEMIGDFNGKIIEAETKIGESLAGKKWAKVNIKIECSEEGLEGRLAFINIFLGKEPPMYGNQEKSQTKQFLDTMKTAKLVFDGSSKENFTASVANLVNQECMFRSWHKGAKNKETGKVEKKFNDAGYKALAQRLIGKDEEDEFSGLPL